MAKNAQTIIDDTFNLLIKTYSPQPVVLDRGDGVYAYDTDGKKYLDFAAGIAVASLGHAHPVIIDTITRQAGRLMACQSSYATQEKLDAAQLLVDTSCMDYVYFSNSGTESVEACIKLARKWAYDNKGPECSEIIAFRKSFHGRTMGSASLTEKRFVQPYFAPYLPGIHFAEFNNIDSVKALVSDKTAMIIVEPVQGEGGLTPATPQFMAGLRKICDDHDIILCFDEVQSGFGRLGTMYAYEAFSCCPDCVDGGAPDAAKAQPIEPDIGAWAKGMGGGFPVGCMMVKKKYGDALQPGMHGTTYGGNPLACAVAAAVIREMLKPGFLKNVQKTAQIMQDGLQQLKRESNKVEDVKGMGLMLGLNTTIEIKTLLRGLQKNGLMATEAGGGTLRLTPPLILTEDQAHEALAIIGKTLKEL